MEKTTNLNKNFIDNYATVSVKMMDIYTEKKVQFDLILPLRMSWKDKRMFSLNRLPEGPKGLFEVFMISPRTGQF